MSRRACVALSGLCLALAATATADAAGRWRLAQTDHVKLEYFQGLTHGAGGVFFVGFSEGAYRTDTNFKESARVLDVYPLNVEALGFNHVGDPTFDPTEGGRLIGPMECYHPDKPEPNTCGIGGFAVIDPVTLAWRYWVRLDQADIPKAMWAETSPDGRLIWTSSGNDLLAYSTADVSAANAATGLDSPPIHPVRRLPGAVPPSGVTGAVFYGGRLLLAGEANGLLQVWSVDVTGTTPPRQEITLPGVRAESEGLDVLDMRGGLLHWLMTPAVQNPTYGMGHCELLTFVPAANGTLRVRASRSGRGLVVTVTSTYAGRSHPVAGATVRAGASKATTKADGKARFKRAPRRGALVKAAKLELAGSTRLR
jgi:hypothetical protein